MFLLQSMVYISLINARVTPEEQRNGSRACMATDGGTDVVDDHFSV